MCYGPDQVEKFLKANNLSIIVRSHQHCQDGIDKFAAAQLITLTSCANYGGTFNNDAAFLVMQKKLVISPKIIKPIAGTNMWMTIPEIPAETNSAIKRDPTPPRNRQQ
jgi:hypothetical protein